MEITIDRRRYHTILRIPGVAIDALTVMPLFTKIEVTEEREPDGWHSLYYHSVSISTRVPGNPELFAYLAELRRNPGTCVIQLMTVVDEWQNGEFEFLLNSSLSYSIPGIWDGGRHLDQQFEIFHQFGWTLGLWGVPVMDEPYGEISALHRIGDVMNHWHEQKRLEYPCNTCQFRPPAGQLRYLKCAVRPNGPSDEKSCVDRFGL